MKNLGQNATHIERTRVGVIGLGDISTKVHLPILCARKDTEVVWSFDINEDKAKHIAKIYSLQLLSLNTLLCDFPEVDVVLMAIPPTQRKTYLDFFVKSDTSFYIEKPFAFSASEHKSICDKFASFRLGNGLQYRSWGRALLLKKIIEEKIFGDLISVELGQGTPLSGFGGRKRKDVGGVLWDLGIHGLDMILNVTKASSVEIQNSKVFEDNDFAHHKQLVNYSEIENYITEGNDRYITIMTNKYTDDKLVLTQLIRNNYKFIGVLGSVAKLKTMWTAMHKEGFSQKELNQVYAPIGIAIKSQTPDEIAISIAAQIIQVKNQQL